MPFYRGGIETRCPIFSLSQVKIPYSEENIIGSFFKKSLKGILADREMRADLSYRVCGDDDYLTKMSYDDFERCIQNLLVGSFENSQLLGSSEAGSGVPDGSFCLVRGESPKLFMWDTKYVKYTGDDVDDDNETDLKGEYDRIFRHLSTIETIPDIKQRFSTVSGIVLFSQGIKKSNVSRLAEFIDENNFIHDSEWNGSVCYFKLDALLHLYECYRENKSHVQEKDRMFRTILYRYLTSTSHHDDPDEIQSSTGNCLEMSVADIQSIFDSLKMFNEEQENLMLNSTWNTWISFRSRDKYYLYHHNR